MSLTLLKIAIIHAQPLLRWGLASACRTAVPAQCVGSRTFRTLELSTETVNVLVLASSVDGDDLAAIRRARTAKRILAVADLTGQTELTQLPGYRFINRDVSIDEFAAAMEDIINQLSRDRELPVRLGNLALTPREQEVLQHLGEGLRTGQIARMMDVSRKTVDAHLANIRQRLGLCSTRELAQWAALRRAGLRS